MSLRDLYERYTNESAPAEAVLREELRKLRDPHTDKRRRLSIVTRYADGESATTIGKRYGIAAASVRTTAQLAMRAVRKAMLGLPRYHETGRPTGRGYGRRTP